MENPMQRKIHDNRLEQLDFLKAVFIVLMVAFHLVYFSEGYP